MTQGGQAYQQGLHVLKVQYDSLSAEVSVCNLQSEVYDIRCCFWTMLQYRAGGDWCLRSGSFGGLAVGAVPAARWDLAEGRVQAGAMVMGIAGVTQQHHVGVSVFATNCAWHVVHSVLSVYIVQGGPLRFLQIRHKGRQKQNPQTDAASPGPDATHA